MFGYVTANWKELTEDQKQRYGAVYCGICRRIQEQSGEVSRLSLSYDMAFLAMLLMSLYEPREGAGKNACLLHPIRRRPWVDNAYVSYAADMNVALAYYNCLDDWQDDKNHAARLMADVLGKNLARIEAAYPRQCRAIRESVNALSQLEKAGCSSPDEPASVFGGLMAELMTCEEDLWAPSLRGLGMALGRFIYLLDAALDYDRDLKRGRYNPYIAMGLDKDWQRWEDYLVLTMARCTEHYEKLPLVQDKALLDNILYSGVWVNYRGRRKGERSQ